MRYVFVYIYGSIVFHCLYFRHSVNEKLMSYLWICIYTRGLVNERSKQAERQRNILQRGSILARPTSLPLTQHIPKERSRRGSNTDSLQYISLPFCLSTFLPFYFSHLFAPWSIHRYIVCSIAVLLHFCFI